VGFIGSAEIDLTNTIDISIQEYKAATIICRFPIVGGDGAQDFVSTIWYYKDLTILLLSMLISSTMLHTYHNNWH
jgi:hypothetical protein